MHKYSIIFFVLANIENMFQYCTRVRSELLVLMLAFLLAEACQGEQNHRHSSNSTCHCSAAGGATRLAKWRRQGCPERATMANTRGEDLVLRRLA